MTSPKAMKEMAERTHDHETIYLQPWCEGCQKHSYGEGRQWCESDVWDTCEDDNCKRQAVKYVRSDMLQTPVDSDVRKILKRILLDIDFMIECEIIPDIRDDEIYAYARAALAEKDKVQP